MDDEIRSQSRRLLDLGRLAAERVDPQMLRAYEQRGLLAPFRTEGGGPPLQS